MSIYFLEGEGLGELADAPQAPGDNATWAELDALLAQVRDAGFRGDLDAAKRAIALANTTASRLVDPLLRSQAAALVAATWSEVLGKNQGAAYKALREAQEQLGREIVTAHEKTQSFWFGVASTFGYGADAVSELQDRWRLLKAQIDAGKESLGADQIQDLRARHQEIFRRIGALNARTNTAGAETAHALDVAAQTGVKAGLLKKNDVVLGGRTEKTAGLDLPNVPRVLREEIPWGKIGLGAAGIAAVYAFVRGVVSRK